jgi:Cd2+/Zn2+-exporting ATPase
MNLGATSPAIEFEITGMDCANCALNLERSISRISEVSSCEVNFATGKMHLTGNADMTAVEARIRALGYDVATPDSAGQSAQPEYTGIEGLIRYMIARRDTTLALLGMSLLLLSAAISILEGPAAAGAILHLLVVALAGVPILINGLREMFFSRNLTINLLMSIATAGAIIIGETGEAATVIVLFSIGEALEGYTADRARYSLRALLRLVPQEAIVLQPCMNCVEHLGKDGYEGGPCPFCGVHETRVPVASLQIGDTILIPPGERIPMDGVIQSGMSAINQAPITGESVPVERGPGDDVFAGSINGTGALEIEVTRLAADNTLNRIIHMVQEAQAQRAPTQRMIDRFALWYTPAVVLVALFVAAIPPLFFDAPFWDTGEGHGWLYRALALLIVACPCALVISTPVTIVSALASAARKGVLIKGGAPLETLASVRAFAFDKTGTLTEGQPKLIMVRSVDCNDHAPEAPCESCNDLLALAAAVERRSEHPLAQAIVAAAQERDLFHRYPPAQEVTSLPGHGVRGHLNGTKVTIGAHAYFDKQFPHAPELCETTTALEQQGQTVMLLADEHRIRGLLSVADQPRDTSSIALSRLRHAAPRARMVMLTGDNQAVAKAIGAAVCVDDVRAGLLPGDKLETVRQLEAQYGPVAMIGDGINDAPALAASTVGIAMGGHGATQAMETADMVLMQDDLSRLPEAVMISQRARSLIRQNVGLSLGIKAAFLVMTLLGSATLWMAVFADMGASLIVTFNGMRMLRR